MWRELHLESENQISKILNEVFCERGSVNQLLMDNEAVFRSEQLRETLNHWDVKRFYRAAYRPIGNGIVEQHHRTMKRLAERSDIFTIELVFWYNMSRK